MIEESTFSREREQVARIVASAGFQSSRLTCEFLRYTADHALTGAHLDQAQIARDVLGRRDFDPTTDASVRKLATQVRQRLERYYEEEGSADEIIVALPLRSYTPTFTQRPAPAPAPAPPPAPKRPWRWAAAAVVLCAGAAAAAWWFRPAPEKESVRILTRRGDIVQPKADPAPDAMRFGPQLGDDDEAFARLTFSPDHEGQHAGIAAWESGERWISVERRFTFRNVLTLGYVDRAGYRVAHEISDFDGQSGSPVWLRLVRRGSEWTASWSHSGYDWHELGHIQGLTLNKPRLAIFAVNGRRESPSIPAAFQFAGVGAALPLLAPCDPQSAPGCTGSSWTRNAPSGDFTITARLDMPSDPRHSAGLFLLGEGGRIRLVRYFAESPRIALIRDGKLLESVPDYAGSPAVFLRFEVRAGRLIARCSVDGIHFQPVGNPVEAAAVGRVRNFGLVASPRTGADAGPPATPPRFFFLQHHL